MKILYDHQIYKMQKFGGVSRYFNELMLIKSSGIEVDTIDPNSIPDAPAPGYIKRGVRFAMRRMGKEIKIKTEALPAIVQNKISREDFDVFHPTYYNSYFLNLIKKPFVLTVHDMLHEIYPENLMYDRTSFDKRLLCEKADAIITVSNTTKDALVEIFNVPSDKITPIYLASDFDKVIARKPGNIDGIENFILFTGARWTYKNFNFSVRALAEVLKADKLLQLLCTGHEFNTEELELFKELGISKQVKHAYLKDDCELAWAYQNARCFIFPSLYEGFGFPLLEAFASNCPVVSSTGGSLKEIGGDGVLFFEPKNFKQIQDATSSALYNSVLRDNLIKQGKREFSKYSWSMCRAKTVGVYKSII